jgi:hypothetical protein
MPVRLLRQLISMLLVAAYLSATILVTAPVAYAAPSEMSGMMMKQDGTGDQTPMPCKGVKAGCVTELGCVFMVSLPAPDLTLTAAIDWLPVTYTVSSEFLEGRSGSVFFGQTCLGFRLHGLGQQGQGKAQVRLGAVCEWPAL